MGKQLTKEEFIKKLESKKRTDVVILGDYINTRTKTLFGCTKKTCKHQWLTTPNHIITGGGCPICANKKVDKNINSVAALRPDLIKYFINPDDAYDITPNSHKKINFICPNCHTEKNMAMYNLTLNGFSCKKCSDYISYPNKFIRVIMDCFKNEIDYLEYEWSDKWTERTRYDVYFEKNNQKYIIEMQGGQHYIAGWKHYRTLEEITKIDEEKRLRALEHGIIPIIIDAKISDFNFIFNNVKNSLLNNLFNLNLINLKQCQKDITLNIIQQVCEKYQKHSYNLMKDIANEFHISTTTLTKYLKIGSEIGWCDYVAGTLSKTKVRALDKNKNTIGEYNSISECVKILSKLYDINLCNSNVSRACQKGYCCHNLYFEYI